MKIFDETQGHDASIVHQNVYLTEMGNGLIREAFPLSGAAYICMNKYFSPACQVFTADTKIRRR